MREFYGSYDVLFRDFFRARLDHDDAISRADDHDVELADGALGVGGVDDEVAIDEADAHRAHGTVKRNVGKGKRAAGTVDAEHVGIVFLIRRVNERDHLGLVAEGFREQRTDGPVDLAAGQDFLFAGTSLALDEAARNASAGVGKLAVFDGEREEVYALFGVGRRHGRAEDGVVARGGERGAGGLLGDPSGLEFDQLAAGKLYSDVMFHGAPLLLSANDVCVFFGNFLQTQESAAQTVHPSSCAGSCMGWERRLPGGVLAGRRVQAAVIVSSSRRRRVSTPRQC